MVDDIVTHLENNDAMVRSFKSMVNEPIDIPIALLQIAFEQGCDVEVARNKLEQLLGNLADFASQ